MDMDPKNCKLAANEIVVLSSKISYGRKSSDISRSLVSRF